MNNKKRNCDCNCEFGKDINLNKQSESKTKQKIEHLYEFGEEFFKDNKEHIKR